MSCVTEKGVPQVNKGCPGEMRRLRSSELLKQRWENLHPDPPTDAKNNESPNFQTKMPSRCGVVVFGAHVKLDELIEETCVNIRRHVSHGLSPNILAP